MPWGKRFPLALQRGTATRPTVAGRVAMGLHNSPGPLALGKPGRAYYYAAWVCGNWGASIGRWRWDCVAAPTILTSALRGARSPLVFPNHTSGSLVEQK